MKFVSAVALLASLASAQVTYDPNSGNFICAVANAAYCAGDSLTSNIIIRCTGTQGFPGNCNDNLAGVPPIGVKTSAQCWQSSSTSANAACSFNGLVYGNNGSFPIPGTSASASSSGAAVTPPANGTASGTKSATTSVAIVTSAPSNGTIATGKGTPTSSGIVMATANAAADLKTGGSVAAMLMAGAWLAL